MRDVNKKEAEVQRTISLNKNDKELQYKIYAIGTKYFLEEREGILHPTSIQMLKEKYGKEIAEDVTHCIGFISEPNHTDYKSIVDNKYNMYKKLTHKPVEGDWTNIEIFLRHIFKEQYTMGLEYFWNLYHHPKQSLPFIGVVSEKKGTGKSTFLTFIRMMFQKNVSTVSEHDFKSNFNSGFVNSLVATSDEHAEGKSRTIIAQRLKMYITEKEIRVEAKGRDAYTSLAYFKLVFAGNDESGLTFIEEENTRYWIIKVDKLELVVFDMEAKLEKEVPHFLYYLINVFEARPSRGRLYFKPSEFQTEASKLIQENSISTLHKEIKYHVKTIFEERTELELYFSPDDLENSLSNKNFTKRYIREVLKNEMKMTPCNNIRYKLFSIGEIIGVSKNGRPYMFERENYVID